VRAVSYDEPEPPSFPGSGPDQRFVFEKKAEAAPVKRGRPRKVSAEQADEALRLYFEERLSMRKVADILGVSHMSVYRMLSDPGVVVLV